MRLLIWRFLILPHATTPAMRLSLSILASAITQTGFVALAVFGSWHIPEAPLTPIELYHPSPTLSLVITPPAPQLAMASSTAEAPLAIAPPEAPETLAPQAAPEPLEQEEEEKQETPPPTPRQKPRERPEAPEAPVTPPPAQELKLVVAAPAETPEPTPPSPALLADADSAVSEPKAGASLTPAAAIAPPAVEPAAMAAGSARRSGGNAPLGEVDRQGLIRDYQRLLFSTIDAHKSVPIAARRARHEGTVYLLVTFDASGKILSIKVRKSSGHDSLDQGAIATLEKIGHLPAPPAALQWQKKSLTIPIRYRMN